MSGPPCMSCTAARRWWTRSPLRTGADPRNPRRTEDRPCHVRYRSSHGTVLQFCFYALWLVCLYRMSRWKLPALLLGFLSVAVFLALYAARLSERERRPLDLGPSLSADIGNGAGAFVPAPAATIFRFTALSTCRRRPLEPRDAGRDVGHPRRVSRTARAPRSRTPSPARRRHEGVAPGGGLHRPHVARNVVARGGSAGFRNLSAVSLRLQHAFDIMVGGCPSDVPRMGHDAAGHFRGLERCVDACSRADTRVVRASTMKRSSIASSQWPCC